jgi:hypothetical protein
VPEWLKGTDCKSVGARLRWFESNPLHCQTDKVENTAAALGCILTAAQAMAQPPSYGDLGACTIIGADGTACFMFPLDFRTTQQPNAFIRQSGAGPPAGHQGSSRGAVWPVFMSANKARTAPQAFLHQRPDTAMNFGQNKIFLRSLQVGVEHGVASLTMDVPSIGVHVTLPLDSFSAASDGSAQCAADIDAAF